MPFFFLTGILCFFVDLNKAKVTGLKKKKRIQKLLHLILHLKNRQLHSAGEVHTWLLTAVSGTVYLLWSCGVN